MVQTEHARRRWPATALLFGVLLLTAGLGACDRGTDADPAASDTAAVALDAADEGAEGPLVLAELFAAPQNWAGREVSVMGRIDEVPTRHAFWLQDQGHRFLVILQDADSAAPTFESGQRVTIREATVFDDLTALPEDVQLDEQTRQIAADEPLFFLTTTATVQPVRDAATGRQVIEMEQSN